MRRKFGMKVTPSGRRFRAGMSLAFGQQSPRAHDIPDIRTIRLEMMHLRIVPVRDRKNERSV